MNKQLIQNTGLSIISYKKKVPIAFLLFLSPLFLFAQSKYEPEILILAPSQTKSDDIFTKQLEVINSELLKKSKVIDENKILASENYKTAPANLQQITSNQLAFAKGLDFYKQASLISSNYLSYRFFEKFPNQMILLDSTVNNGSLENLRLKGTAAKLQYVLNYKAIELYKEKNIGYAKMHVQLYDRYADSLVIDKTYIGDWFNPGFEFTCEDKSLNCTLNNALSKVLKDVIFVIATRNPTLIAEGKLAGERAKVLEEYLHKDFSTEKLKLVLANDSNINLSSVYQALYPQDQKKFIAFFMEQVPAQQLKNLNAGNKDHNVKIISNKEITDKAYFDIPKTYAYTVTAVMEDGKWYYEKSNVTYFEPENSSAGKKQFFNNLQQWNFFKENTTETHTDFWETNLFGKVIDLRKDKDWDKYGKGMWENEEANNRDYIGMYEIVANSLKKSRAAENLKFEKSTSAKLKLYYEKIKATPTNHIKKYSAHALIYPRERNLAINPVLITNQKGVSEIQYFVVFDGRDEIYSWTYFPSLVLSKEMNFGSSVVDQMNTITKFNFSYDNLNDSAFWKQYVLSKTDKGYSFLKKVN